jgi:KaiC/GvpD/RAD55 family RecA-like ATPase
VKGLVPEEIRNFFSDGRGKTLLAKGPPGSGKTCFAFTLLLEIGGNGVYLSTRVDPEALYGQLSWLKEVLPEESIIDATQSERQRTAGARETALIRPLKYADVPDFLKGVYQRTEKLESPVVIVDSWDAVVSHTGFYEPRERERLENNLCDFARKTGTRMIFIAEYIEQKALDYLVDGVAVIESNLYDGRRIRRLDLQKLRGQAIRQPSYLFSLHSGIFKCFPTPPALHAISAPTATANWHPLPDLGEGRVSTGTRDLDAIIHGFGNFSVLQGDYMPYELLLVPFILNSLILGRRVILSSSHQSLVRKVSPFVPHELLKQLRVVTELGQELVRSISALAEEVSDGSLVFVLNVNEVGADRSVVRELISAVTEKSGVFLGFIGDESETGGEIESMGSVSLVTKMLCGVPCLYGRSPVTEIHAMELKMQNGTPEISLTPVV